MRAVTVRAINLCDVYTPIQLNFTMDITQHEKRDKIELAVERIRKGMDGLQSILAASIHI